MGALARALAWIFNFLIWVPLLLVGVLLSPFALLYKLFLCLLTWFSFIPKGKTFYSFRTIRKIRATISLDLSSLQTVAQSS